jgi:hypothetical protein
VYDLRFVVWGIVVEERPGTLLSIFRLNSKNFAHKRLKLLQPLCVVNYSRTTNSVRMDLVSNKRLPRICLH